MGAGKRSPIDEYRITNRGGKGVKTLQITPKTGNLVAIKGVTDADELMIINKSGITIRLRMDDIRVIGRATQGVRLLKLNEGDEISSVAKIEVEEKNDNGLGGDGDGAEAKGDILPDDSLASDLTDPDLINEN